MSIIDAIRTDAIQHSRRIILPESTDTRILQAAISAQKLGIVQPVLLGNPDAINLTAQDHGLDISKLSLFEIDNCSSDTQLHAYLASRKAYQGRSKLERDELLNDPLTAALCLLATDQVDACVAGAAYSTASVIGQGLKIIGTSQNSPLLSSFMLMVFSSPPVPNLDFALFADCAINVRPNAKQLAQITQDCAFNAHHLFNLDPKIALLSFSTSGSASHDDVTLIQQATKQIRANYPTLTVLGEVQFDAALMPEVRALKMSDCDYTQPANVFIFPNLDAGNIGYKIAERLGGAQVIGPILQGLNKPLNDVSRGADVESIINTLALTCLQSVSK